MTSISKIIENGTATFRDNSRASSEKPRLIDIRRAHKPPIHPDTIAKAAGVLLCREFLVEIGGLVSKSEAEHVLHAFSALTGKTYTTANVAVNIKPEQARESKS